MVCDCCLRRKKLFESFAAIQTDEGTMNLCVQCNDLAYKIRDDANEKNKKEYDEHLRQLEKRGKKAKPIFFNWKKIYTKGLEKILSSQGDGDCESENGTNNTD